MKGLVMPVLVPSLVLSWAGQDCQANIIESIERRNSPRPTPVIAGPLEEYALSYVDRTHRYREIPSALVGAEYVMVANNDKMTPSYELDVTLGQPATVYLLLDNRLGYGSVAGGDRNMNPDVEAAGMYWVEDEGFLDTDWDLAIDEQDDGTINQYFSVFSKDVAPGTITLYQQYDTTYALGRNMYGVAVVPEPMSLSFLGLGTVFALRRRRRGIE